MNRFAVLTAALFGAAAVGALAQQPAAEAGGAATAPGQAAAASVVRITASVESVDAANRTVTLKGPRGRVVTLPVGPEVQNFDQIKAGDIVVVRYLEALSLELKKSGSGIRERAEIQAGAAATPGERPAAGEVRQATVIADVVGVDAKRQIVTLRGPRRTVDLKVRDPNQLKLLKLGDQVEATYTEATAISVEPAPKSVRVTQPGR
jgi:Cu/Ag efflux protein CusF